MLVLYLSMTNCFLWWKIRLPFNYWLDFAKFKGPIVITLSTRLKERLNFLEFLILFLNWPPQSTSLNPIEILGFYLYLYLKMVSNFVDTILWTGNVYYKHKMLKYVNSSFKNSFFWSKINISFHISFH